MKKSNWNIKFDGRGKAANTIIEQVLKDRGVSDIKEFLYPSGYNIYPSTALHRIEKAAEIVLNSKHPLVYADTDTDGCTAGAIIYRWIKTYFDIIPKYYINKEKDHGIQDYFTLPEDDDTDLIIVVDSINDNIKQYQRFLDIGKKIVVLDHHTITDEVLTFGNPDFVLVSSADNYPNPGLSGAGVVWKFCKYLDTLTNCNIADDLVDLAACGIIADVCSVGTDSMENRAICHQGFLNKINPGITELCGSDVFNSTQVGFNIAPLINAANRMDSNDLAFLLLILDDKKQVKEIIKELTKIKASQKALVAKYLPQLVEQAESQINNKVIKVIINGIDNLSGLLATNLCDRYKRPVLVLHDKGDTYAGSMRSYGTNDFSAIVNESGFGECRGHENSAGIEIPKCYWEPFCLWVEDELSNYVFSQDYDVDVLIESGQANNFLISSLQNINRITGANFPPIKFCIDNISRFEIKSMSDGKHLSINTPNLRFVYWNFNDWSNVKEDTQFSAIGTLERNFFMRKSTIQMLMEDYNFAEIKPFIKSRIFHPDRVIEF